MKFSCVLLTWLGISLATAAQLRSSVDVEEVITKDPEHKHQTKHHRKSNHSAPSAAAMESEVLLAMTGKDTPELKAFKEKLLRMIEEELKPAVLANQKKMKGQIDTMVKEFNTCAADGLKSGEDYKKKFETAKAEHATCRAGEATASDSKATCEKELAVLKNATKTQCDAVEALEKSQSNIQSSCATASGESYVSQMQRLADSFTKAVTTYKDQQAGCEKAKAAETTKADECKTKTSSYTTKKATCDKAQATMDSSSCAYGEAVTVGCGECHKEAKKGYENAKPGFAEQQASMEQEMSAILRIECYVGTLSKSSSEKKSALEACAKKDYLAQTAVAELKLTFPDVPDATCPAPDDIAGTSKYKARVYDVLPDQAPAGDCAASCCKAEQIVHVVYTEGDNSAGTIKADNTGTISGLTVGTTYKVNFEILRNDLGSSSEYVTGVTIDGTNILAGGKCNPDGGDYDCTFFNCAIASGYSFTASKSSAQLVVSLTGHSWDCDCDKKSWACSKESTVSGRTKMTAVGRFTFTPQVTTTTTTTTEATTYSLIGGCDARQGACKPGSYCNKYATANPTAKSPSTWQECADLCDANPKCARFTWRGTSKTWCRLCTADAGAATHSDWGIFSKAR